jgi:hypothetical protein
MLCSRHPSFVQFFYRHELLNPYKYYWRMECNETRLFVPLYALCHMSWRQMTHLRSWNFTKSYGSILF